MIFIDRSIPRAIAEALQKVRPDVLWLEDVWIFRHDTKDEVWLTHVGFANWLAISRDKKIRTRPAERERIIAAGVGAFIFTQKTNLKKWDYLKLLGRSLDEMEDKFRTVPRPFIYGIQKDGALKKIA